MKKNEKRLVIAVLLSVVGCLIGLAIFKVATKVALEEELSYNEVVAYIEQGKVSKITGYNDSTKILITMTDGTSRNASVPNMVSLSSFVSNKIENGAEIEFTLETRPPNIFSILINIFEGVLIGLGFVTLVILITLKIVLKDIMSPFKKKKSKKNEDSDENDEDKIVKEYEEYEKVAKKITDIFSEVTGSGAQFKPVESHVKFSDVAGIDEEKAQLEEIVWFLKEPEMYHSKGARIPKGILLSGEPGTGKTLLAKAIAGEAGVPFFQANGSSFDEKYVGVGASRIRELFKKAKEEAPCLIFIDEIDSVAKSRYSGESYSAQTLNQLLAEMDGFETKDNIIVIAATNHMDVMDEALIRAGRFDRHVVVPMPDVIAREKILKVHAKNKFFDEEVSLAEIAKKTVGFSGADLENILNEAAIYAVNVGNGIIDKAAIDEAIARVIVGLKKKNSAVTSEDKYLTAIHEAGHAIVSAVVRPEIKNFGISIVPRGDAGGYNFFDEANKMYPRREDMFKRIQVLYGGRIAEDLVLGDISTGASSDLEKATRIAYQMVTKYAMRGHLITEIPNAKDFNNHLATNQMTEIENLCNEAYEEAESVLKENKAYLLELADMLMEKEYLSQEEVEEFVLEHFGER